MSPAVLALLQALFSTHLERIPNWYTTKHPERSAFLCAKSKGDLVGHLGIRSSGKRSISDAARTRIAQAIEGLDFVQCLGRQLAHSASHLPRKHCPRAVDTRRAFAVVKNGAGVSCARLWEIPDCSRDLRCGSRDRQDGSSKV